MGGLPSLLPLRPPEPLDHLGLGRFPQHVVILRPEPPQDPFQVGEARRVTFGQLIFPGRRGSSSLGSTCAGKDRHAILPQGALEEREAKRVATGRVDQSRDERPDEIVSARLDRPGKLASI